MATEVSAPGGTIVAAAASTAVRALPGQIARLAVRVPNWLGDAVMALPAMAAVRAALPGAIISVAARDSVAPLFQENTIARPDAVIAIRDRARESALLREGRFDTILLLPNSFGSAWAARGAGVPNRWGYRAFPRGALLTRSVSRPSARVQEDKPLVSR